MVYDHKRFASIGSLRPAWKGETLAASTINHVKANLAPALAL